MHLEESSRSLTAFITPFGVYEWKVLPMGVKVGPQVFQRWLRGLYATALLVGRILMMS